MSESTESRARRADAGLAGAALLLAAAVATTTLGAPLPQPVRFKILLSQAGIYRVTYEQLQAAGLADGATAGAILLSNRGEPVPVWERGDTETFGPGGELVFAAQRLHGDHSWLDEHSQHNVYVLEIGGASGPEMHQAPPVEHPPADTEGLALTGFAHLERDLLLHRFARDAEAPPLDDWFWSRLTQIDRQPFRVRLDLSDLDRERPVSLRLALRGWSKPMRRTSEAATDHVVLASLNGVEIGRAEWSAQEEAVLTIDPIDSAVLRQGKNLLELAVPRRVAEGQEDALVDVSLLNWIEVTHGRRGLLTGTQESFIRPPQAGTLRMRTPVARSVLAFSGDDVVFAAGSSQDGTHHGVWLDAVTDSPARLQVVADEAFLEPDVIVFDIPSDLSSTARQADYLMIVHPSLREAIEPLAAFHRQRGLSVEVIDVFDIYDEFNYGIIDPRAIRDFVSHAYHRWEAPAPRFVLLVGDASWDTKNSEHVSRNYVDWTYQPGEVRRTRSNKLTPYAEGSELDRNLVPTWKYSGAQGHAASDNYFVAIAGEDYLPDLAIGRFPVVEPAEVAAIVTKTIRYMSENTVGPWRRSVLWITNESLAFQRRTDELAAEMAARGFNAKKVYPSSEEADNIGHQQTLIESLNQDSY